MMIDNLQKSVFISCKEIERLLIIFNSDVFESEIIDAKHYNDEHYKNEIFFINIEYQKWNERFVTIYYDKNSIYPFLDEINIFTGYPKLKKNFLINNNIPNNLRSTQTIRQILRKDKNNNLYWILNRKRKINNIDGYTEVMIEEVWNYLMKSLN
jgi:hypothetical protein